MSELPPAVVKVACHRHSLLLTNGLYDHVCDLCGVDVVSLTLRSTKFTLTPLQKFNLLK